MKKELHEQVLVAVNAFLPSLVYDDYLDMDEEDAVSNTRIDRKKIIELVLTLKHDANPLGDYPSFDETLRNVEELKPLFKIIDDPRQLLTQVDFSKEPAETMAEMKKLIQVKLNEMADKIIEKYTLQGDITESLKNTVANLPRDQKKTAAEAWWRSKSAAEQQAIIKQYQELNSSQQVRLQQSRATSLYYQPVYIAIVDRGRSIDLFDLYFMTYFSAQLIHLAVDLSIVGIKGIFILSHLGARATCSLLGCAKSLCDAMVGHSVEPSNPQGNNQNKCKEVVLALLVLTVFALLISAAFVTGPYGLKKAWKSMKDIFNCYKLGRSFWRLGCISGGGALGGFLCAQWGAELSALVPTLIAIPTGTAIAMAAGIFIGIGVGAFLAKYIAKGISALYYKDELNPTNPDKYRLTIAQAERWTQRGIEPHKIDKLIKHIRHEKKQGNMDKDECNQLLKKVRNAEVGNAVIVVGRPYWLGSATLFFKPPVPDFSDVKSAEESVASAPSFDDVHGYVPLTTFTS